MGHLGHTDTHNHEVRNNSVHNRTPFKSLVIALNPRRSQAPPGGSQGIPTPALKRLLNPNRLLLLQDPADLCELIFKAGRQNLVACSSLHWYYYYVTVLSEPQGLDQVSVLFSLLFYLTSSPETATLNQPGGTIHWLIPDPEHKCWINIS